MTQNARYPTAPPSPFSGVAAELVKELTTVLAPRWGGEEPAGELTLGVTMRARQSATIRADSPLARTTPIIRTVRLPELIVPESWVSVARSSAEQAQLSLDWAAVVSDMAEGMTYRTDLPRGTVLDLFANPVPHWVDDLNVKARVQQQGTHNPSRRLATVGLLVSDSQGLVFDVPDAMFWMTFNFGLAVDGTVYEPIPLPHTGV